MALISAALSSASWHKSTTNPKCPQLRGTCGGHSDTHTPSKSAAAEPTQLYSGDLLPTINLFRRTTPPPGQIWSVCFCGSRFHARMSYGGACKESKERKLLNIHIFCMKLCRCTRRGSFCTGKDLLGYFFGWGRDSRSDCVCVIVK